MNSVAAGAAVPGRILSWPPGPLGPGYMPRPPARPGYGATRQGTASRGTVSRWVG